MDWAGWRSVIDRPYSNRLLLFGDDLILDLVVRGLRHDLLLHRLVPSLVLLLPLDLTLGLTLPPEWWRGKRTSRAVGEMVFTATLTRDQRLLYRAVMDRRLETATALGLTILPSLLAQADQVIE